MDGQGHLRGGGQPEPGMGPELENERFGGEGWKLNLGEGNTPSSGGGLLEPLDQGGVGQRMLASECVGGKTAAFEIGEDVFSTSDGLRTAARE